MSARADDVNVKSIVIRPGDALIVVDVQRDYLPGGALAVPHGDAVVEPLNRVIDQFVRTDLPIFYIRDWHPAQHVSPVNHGSRLPVHCIAGTAGAEFAPRLWIAQSDPIIPLTAAHDHGAVSAFEGTPLAEQLNRTETKRIFIGGLAMEHCVMKTALDAMSRGYEVYVILDAVRAASARSGDDRRALRVMRRQGARTTRAANILAG